MQDRDDQRRKTDTDPKTQRLAEALRANLGKRKALARAKKAAAQESSGDALEMPQGTGRDDKDTDASS